MANLALFGGEGAMLRELRGGQRQEVWKRKRKRKRQEAWKNLRRNLNLVEGLSQPAPAFVCVHSVVKLLWNLGVIPCASLPACLRASLSVIPLQDFKYMHLNRRPRISLRDRPCRS